MQKWLLLIVLAITANATLVRGQPVAENGTPGSAVVESIDPIVEEKPSTPGRFAILPGRRSKEEPAENAEAAEALAAEKRAGRFWVRGEFLLWWIKTANLAPLVTTGSLTDVRPGSLGAAGTSVLYGQSGMDFQDRGGGRFSAGWWFDEEHDVGVEAGYFFVTGRSLGQSFASAGSPVLAQPFFNARGGFQDSSLVAFPGITSGNVAVDVPSFFQGAEANLSGAFLRSESFRWEALGGFRYLNLDEGLHINSNSVVALAQQYKNLGIPFAGNTIAVSDRFDANNHFYGGQLGGRAELRHKRWTLDVLGKAALGVSNQNVSINGVTRIDAQPATVQNAGLYAVASNSGLHSRNVFAVVPEVAVNLKFDLTRRIRLFGGYTFVYWSSVARPWEQFDPAVNPNLVPSSATFGAGGGAVRPAFAFRSTSFFAQGANFGLEFRY